VITGDIGYRDTVVFTALGDTVNVTARLEELTKELECQVVLSDEALKTAGLEIDIALFRKAQARSIIFGLFTTTVPLLFGTLLGLGFGYALIPAIVVGSLLASHTLLRQSTARYRTIRRGSSWNSLAKPCSSRASLSSPVW